MKARNKVGRPRKEPYVAVKAYLSEQNKAWIDENGGATRAINLLIQQAINSDNNCQGDNNCHQ